MADYSEFPTTPTAWQERQLEDWQTVLPLSTEDVEPPRKRSVDVFDEGAADGYFPGRGAGATVDDGVPDVVLVINNGLGDVEVSRG